MRPAPPATAHFDPEQDLWILSRHADVAAALREPRLWPTAGRPEDRDETSKLRVRPRMLEFLRAAGAAEWQASAEKLAGAALDQLPADRPVEILGEFAKPWCLSVAMLVTGAPASARARLALLSDRVFAGTGEPEESPLRQNAAAATSELERFYENSPIPMGEPTFIAVAQTTARLLTNSWLALFRHPCEYTRLRSQPDLVRSAADEFLRYAGIVRRVYRRATAEVNLGGCAIAKGQRAALMLASANRDPEVFPDPDRLDVGRCVAGHLALGAGPNSCVGNPLIRMVLTAATGALVRRFQAAEVIGVDGWRTASGFYFPIGVHVLFKAADFG